MPITKSAKKALRQNRKRKLRNIADKKKIKELTKKVKFLASQKNKKEGEKFLPQIYKALDKAAKTGVIKKNKAARKKSRITKLVNKN
jgi:small subunit ribosomal protein S20